MSIGHMQDQALRAAREGRGIHRYLDDDPDVTAAFVVETNAAIYYDIPAGKQVVMHTLNYGLSNASKDITIYPVSCAAITGGGAATQLMHHFKSANSANNLGDVYLIQRLDQPIVVKYSSGARSVSLAVKGTDTDVIGTYGWCGWVEDEGTLS